jgi:hypothetical protein
MIAKAVAVAFDGFLVDEAGDIQRGHADDADRQRKRSVAGR